MKYRSEFLNYCEARGFLHQCTDITALDALLAQKKPVVAYCGFDCTAPSLHVGHLLPIMLMRAFQKFGHTPIALMGGATTKVGDPTGRDTSRPILTDEEISRNMAGIIEVFSQFMHFGEGAGDALMLNNADWIEKIGYLELLNTIGRHFSVNRMLSMDSVRLRLDRESEMSFLELNYMIFQAYDFVHLNREHGCRIQFGGSDQWGNIVGGVDLHRRLKAEENAGKKNVYEELFGFTTPLLTTASGGKMGKTSGGAIWLNAELLTPYDYWQFWRNTEDADVGKFLRLFTEIPMDEIQKLEALQGSEVNEAKKILATEATALLHGREAAIAAATTAHATFEQGTLGGGLPEITLLAVDVEKGISVATLMHKVNLAESGGEAKRLIRGGGAKINDATVTDENFKITESLFENKKLKLSAGKKRHVVIKLI